MNPLNYFHDKINDMSQTRYALILAIIQTSITIGSLFSSICFYFAEWYFFSIVMFLFSMYKVWFMRRDIFVYHKVKEWEKEDKEKGDE